MEGKNAVILLLFVAIIGLTVSAYMLYSSSSVDVTQGDKKILLCAVDETEKRPGMGAIDMAFIINMKDGKIVNETSVYPGKMYHPTKSPPAALQAMGLNRWLLHDSLWNNNTEEGVQVAKEIVEYHTGEKIDVVVLVNTQAVDAMIRSIGPVYVEGRGNVNGSTLSFVRESQYAGASRGPAVEAVMQAMTKAVHDKTKLLTLLQAGINQYQQGNIVVIPKEAMIKFMLANGIKRTF